MKGVDANDIARNDGIPSLRDLIDEAARWDNPPRINGDGELQGRGRRGNRQTALPQALTIAEWRARKLHDPDCLMGKWMTTTSRILQVAPTGVGKTTLMLHLGMAAAAGKDFLHWSGQRPCRLLYVDGEMRTYHALDDDWGSSFRDSGRHWLRWLRTGEGPMLWSADEAVDVLRFALAVYASSAADGVGIDPASIQEA